MSVNLKQSPASELPVDRDETVEAAVLALLMNEGHHAVGALRSNDWSGLNLKLNVEHFASSVHRAIYSRIMDALKVVHGHGCVDPIIIRTQLLDAHDEAAADAVMEIALSPARLESARFYVDRLHELKVRRDENRARAKAEVKAREVSADGGR